MNVWRAGLKNTKRLEDATKGDVLVYLTDVSYFYAQNKGPKITEIRLIPYGSVLEIVSIYRKKDGLCTIKASGVPVLESPTVILIQDLKTFDYKEFIVVDKRSKSEIKLLYDV